MPRKTPELNASSTADIAFLLLIFFLVTTTMDVDSGMYRKLPAYQEDNTQVPKISRRNLLEVKVNANNALLVGGNLMDISSLKETTKDFILKTGDDMPERVIKDIPFFGKVEISRGIVSLQNDKGTSYATYIAVQDQLASAFNEVRDMRSQDKWGKPFSKLNAEQQEAIKDLIPMNISEAEPKNIGGTK